MDRRLGGSHSSSGYFGEDRKVLKTALTLKLKAIFSENHTKHIKIMCESFSKVEGIKF